MTPGEARGLATFLRSLREEWQTPPILAALEKLSDQRYSTQDITEVCVAIALEPSNQLPVMLSMKGEEMIRRKHQGSKPRVGGNSKLPDQYKCDVCGKVRSVCMSSARSADGASHAFVSAAERNADRDEMHADGRIEEAVAAARAKALDRATRGGMFALPADVTTPQHPEPEQESA